MSTPQSKASYLTRQLELTTIKPHPEVKMHADPMLPCGFRGREEMGRRGEKGMVKEGINECGLRKRKASHRVDVFVFLTAPRPS